jgi:hypothetical protein
VPSENTPVESSTSTAPSKTTQIIAFQQAQTNDGRQVTNIFIKLKMARM